MPYNFSREGRNFRPHPKEYLPREYNGREQKSINYVSNKKYYKSYKSSSKENVMRQEGLNGIKRILRDRDVNYIFSMNENFIHDKTCPEVLKFQRSELRYVKEYPCHLPQCARCAHKAYLRNGASDIEKFNVYMSFFKKINITDSLIRHMYIDCGMKTTLIEDDNAIQIYYKNDVWRVILLNNQGNVRLLHNNYRVENGRRVFCAGFHIQSEYCKETNIQFALSVIENYSWVKHVSKTRASFLEYRPIRTIRFRKKENFFNMNMWNDDKKNINEEISENEFLNADFETNDDDAKSNETRKIPDYGFVKDDRPDHGDMYGYYVPRKRNNYRNNNNNYGYSNKYGQNNGGYQNNRYQSRNNNNNNGYSNSGYNNSGYNKNYSNSSYNNSGYNKGYSNNYYRTTSSYNPNYGYNNTNRYSQEKRTYNTNDFVGKDYRKKYDNGYGMPDSNRYVGRSSYDNRYNNTYNNTYDRKRDNNNWDRRNDYNGQSYTNNVDDFSKDYTREELEAIDSVKDMKFSLEVKDFNLVSEDGYPTHGKKCVYIWVTKEGNFQWQIGEYDFYKRQFSISYPGDGNFVTDDKKVVAWQVLWNGNIIAEKAEEKEEEE